MFQTFLRLVFSRRCGSLIAALICFGGVAFSYFYIQKTLFMMPCPLCIIQRLIFIMIGCVFLADFAFYPRSKGGSKMMYLLKLLSIFSGIAVAARHLYLQSLPPGKAPACGLDFYGMFEQYPFFEALGRSLLGTGDCATKQSWLFLTIPQWSMSIYVALLIYAIILHRKA